MALAAFPATQPTPPAFPRPPPTHTQLRALPSGAAREPSNEVPPHQAAPPTLLEVKAQGVGEQEIRKTSALVGAAETSDWEGEEG